MLRDRGRPFASAKTISVEFSRPGRLTEAAQDAENHLLVEQ
jgi:hypothetical protein